MFVHTNAQHCTSPTGHQTLLLSFVALISKFAPSTKHHYIICNLVFKVSSKPSLPPLPQLLYGCRRVHTMVGPTSDCVYLYGASKLHQSIAGFTISGRGGYPGIYRTPTEYWTTVMKPLSSRSSQSHAAEWMLRGQQCYCICTYIHGTSRAIIGTW